MNQKFSILSTGAPLVEVNGNGPYVDHLSGLRIADASLKHAPVELLTHPVRRFRVDAPPSVRTIVAVTDSPFGASLRVRRRAPLSPRRFFAVTRWPRLRSVVRTLSPSLVALWHLFTDESPRQSVWRDVCERDSHQVAALGVDLVVVAFRVS